MNIDTGANIDIETYRYRENNTYTCSVGINIEKI